MFKTITVFEIADNDTLHDLSTDVLLERISEPTAADPDKTQWSRAGFTLPPIGEAPVYIGSDYTRVFVVQIRERILPAKVIQTEVRKRAADIATRQGYKPSRKVMAELKEEVVAQMLPTAFIKPTDIICAVTGPYLIIGTGSAKQVDTVLQTLNAAYFDSVNQLKLMPIDIKRDTWRFMMNLLLNGSTDSGMFHVGRTVALKGDAGKAVRFKEMNLGTDGVHEAINSGLKPVEIAVTYADETGDRLFFSFTEQFGIKRIKFADIVTEQADESEDAAAYFDTTVALVCGEVRALLDNLTSEMPRDSEDEL